jgi:zinc D-Ala-D-Ala dipeptidase
MILARTLSALFILLSGVHAYAELKEARLVDIQALCPQIKVNLFLESGDNPLNLTVYPKGTKAYMLEDAAYALIEVQKELEPVGYGLEIADAFRPLWAQKKLWDAVQLLNLPRPDDYISDPYTEGGRHTRGTAVDLKIIKLDDGTPLSFPPFSFDQRAHQDYFGPGITPEQISNRELLKSLMIKHGFTPIKTEWWHYDYKNWRDYKPLNYQFSEIPSSR